MATTTKPTTTKTTSSIVEKYALVDFEDGKIYSPLTKQELEAELKKMTYDMDDDDIKDCFEVIQFSTGKVYEIDVKKSYELIPLKAN